ncbi:Hypothetical Protein FCC1311_015242 [Hondaea fermentalgiana]|uniref:Protein kinase domain-containing protein n=1 Tax=Hondaea fermentalgiana TaxID=2315210 RepID=A0A2R5G2Q4_9STRA|nr:Hypothetical Protein FCC1311_015242 [Hondaea fermentalgiana]|eukprot:GBG25307.1 Hypothetical Protein FCC1311_015242 [Hondaea fermentalgiana]
MAATRPFAEILLDTPMEDAALVDKYNATRVKVMQLIEQDASDFLGDRPLPSSGAVSSQYSSRSRGGLAPQSGVQARLDLLPVNVLAWQDFEDEVGWDRFAREVGFGDVQVSPVPFATGTEVVRTLSETDAFDHLKLGFTGPASRFLVHEHKSPVKFPYGLTQRDLAQIAQSWMQDSNTSLDYAKETVKSAWELACEDLTEYWELGGSFANRESSVRFRYPIIQIYVYMLRSFCKYGVLSTTDKTWFFKLEADNILYISRMFRAEAAGRESVRYAYACMLHRSATSSARLSLTEAHLRAICQTNIRLGSQEWTQIYENIGYGGGSGATALAALTAVHGAGVAHRDVLLRNFVMDASGAVRIIDFAQAKTNASHRDFQKDRDAFESVFSLSESRGRRKA